MRATHVTTMLQLLMWSDVGVSLSLSTYEVGSVMLLLVCVQRRQYGTYPLLAVDYTSLGEHTEVDELVEYILRSCFLPSRTDGF